MSRVPVGGISIASVSAPQQPSLIQNVLEGARKGAIRGGLCGAVVIASAGILVGTSAVCTKVYNLSAEDIRRRDAGAGEPYFSSFFSFSACMVCGGAAIGAAIGAIHAVTQNAFSDISVRAKETRHLHQS